MDLRGDGVVLYQAGTGPGQCLLETFEMRPTAITPTQRARRCQSLPVFGRLSVAHTRGLRLPARRRRSRQPANCVTFGRLLVESLRDRHLRETQQKMPPQNVRQRVGTDIKPTATLSIGLWYRQISPRRSHLLQNGLIPDRPPR